MMRYYLFRATSQAFHSMTLVFALLSLVGTSQADVSVAPLDGRVRIEVDGQLFTEYCFKEYAKPILYPLIGPQGVPMTRNFPMQTDVAGEAHDHRHHRSVWFTHGNVNGVDFWAEGDQKGKVVHERVIHQAGGEECATLATSNHWIGPDGKRVCRDVQEMWFRKLEQGDRAIDFRITIHASDGDLVFGDTKEGTFGIRTHPNLRLENDPPDVTTAAGTALNSEGVTGGGVWGKRARWVDFTGAIEGHSVGIAIFDHSQNPRHPTWWHARQYGLVAANPFGVHDFEKKPAGTGDLKVKNGERIVFRYRLLLHQGLRSQVQLDAAYEAYEGDDAPRVSEVGRLPPGARLGPL